MMQLTKNPTKHNISLVWNSSLYQPGVMEIYEPRYAKHLLQYEVFAGMTMMQLTKNHIQVLMHNLEGSAHLSSFLQESKQVEPRIIITAVSPGSSADDVLSPGLIVESINDQKIRTMKDLREHFVPTSGDTWQLQTDKGKLFVVNFKEELLQSLKLNRKGWGPLSESVNASLTTYLPVQIQETATTTKGNNLSSAFIGGKGQGELEDSTWNDQPEGESLLKVQEENERKHFQELADVASQGATDSLGINSSLTDKLMQAVNRIVSGLDTPNVMLDKELQKQNG